MDLKDATLVFLTESGAHPSLEQIAQRAYDQIVSGRGVSHDILSDLIGEASGKGVLRELHRKYSPVAYDAIMTPIFTEIDRQKPVPPRQRPVRSDGGPDPLTADFSSIRW